MKIFDRIVERYLETKHRVASYALSKVLTFLIKHTADPLQHYMLRETADGRLIPLTQEEFDEYFAEAFEIDEEPGEERPN